MGEMKALAVVHIFHCRAVFHVSMWFFMVAFVRTSGNLGTYYKP
ncbi:hypothetical protein Nmel_006939 [Mimus melanotis]